jgi:hypothetical protein
LQLATLPHTPKGFTVKYETVLTNNNFINKKNFPKKLNTEFSSFLRLDIVLLSEWFPIFCKTQFLPLSRFYKANLLGHPGSEVVDTMFLRTVRNSH